MPAAATIEGVQVANRTQRRVRENFMRNIGARIKLVQVNYRRSPCRVAKGQDPTVHPLETQPIERDA